MRWLAEYLNNNWFVKMFYAGLLALILLFSAGSAGAEEMSLLSDKELSDITGHGFSHFSLTGNMALVELNMQTATFIEIDSLKMGYYDNGSSTGWDQNWNGVSLGSDSQDLVLNNFIFQAEFSDISDSGTRRLLSMQIGFNDVSGQLDADFQSLSILSGSNRDVPGQATFSFDHDRMVLVISAQGVNQGIWFDFGNAQQAP